MLVCVRWGRGIDENTRFATRVERPERISVSQSNSKCPRALPPGTRGRARNFRGAAFRFPISWSSELSSRWHGPTTVFCFGTMQTSPSQAQPGQARPASPEYVWILRSHARPSQIHRGSGSSRRQPGKPSATLIQGRCWRARLARLFQPVL